MVDDEGAAHLLEVSEDLAQPAAAATRDGIVDDKDPAGPRLRGIGRAVRPFKLLRGRIDGRPPSDKGRF